MSSTEADARVVAGRYQLERPLGRGGMGVVWLAHDTLLKRRVAVKEIQFPSGVDPASSEAIKRRALREARSAARLAHPNVVTIFDVLQEEEGAFIVMEYVEAPTLGDQVKAHGPMSPERVAEVGLDVLAALAAAHEKGIVHRDVKPGNVMVFEEGRAKLADFGIASVKDDPKITSTGMILGSPQFMAPEQATANQSGPETDLWSLGTTLYYAVEGALPFNRGQALPTLAAVIHDDPRPMGRAGPLEPAISAFLSKSPDDRPSTDEAREMLQEVADGPAGKAYTPAAAASTSAEPASAPEPQAARWEEPVRTRDEITYDPDGDRRRSFSGLLAVLALLAVVGGAAFFLLARDDPPETSRGPGTGQDEGGNEGSNRGNGGGGRQGQGEDPQPEEDQEASVPSDWVAYEDPGVGYTLSHPPDWDVVQVDESMTDFRDPQTGTYLRVDWTDEPGPSPEGAWEAQSASFGQSHDNYQEIQITPTTFKGYDAAIWEFSYSEGGADLHAVDLGFVIGDDYGFALNFQTHEEDWEDSQALFEQLKSSWQPPGS